ncbi:MAG: ATP-binding cassette domain-containing protein, partial [Deltaproteobacteria bacterium]|nr:ATP-binding cassette domain-containing protein [Deltaproteobacteria bacterium]
MELLEGRGLTKAFGGLTAIFDVDFHIKEGEILGLIGPNGAGKTTLFNLLSGTYTHTSGSTWFKGENITRLKPNQICRRGISRTFQLIKLFGNM